ncbi:MAG: hypothetical protein FWD06_05245 [Oscillospiraceae bacterium]|nr:hypothetical protein [Oscillospiraceae bacterium]
MKKVLALIAAIAMIVSLGVVLTACNRNNNDNDNDNDSTTIYYTTDEYTAEGNDNEETTEPVDETTTTVETTTTEAATTEPADPYLPPDNLNQLSQAEQLEYFNRVVNRVHRERPGHTQVQTLRIESLNFTGAVSAVQGIINGIVNRLMPGDPETRVRARGQENQYYWMSNSPNFGSNLRAQDIARITSTRQGNNWRIEVRVREENNPQHFVSHHGRIASIQTREEIIASIVDDAPVTGDPNNANVRYHNGFAWVVVNPQGQIIEAANGFDVNAQIDSARIGVGILSVGTNVTALQTSRWTYSNFGW